MRRHLPGGYELDDDPARIDLEAVHRYLSGQSYWAKGRLRETVEGGPLAGVKWLLHTRDAHGLYRKLGFGSPGERLLERNPG